MGAINSIGNTMMQAIMLNAKNDQGMALLNLMDASRKVEVASVSPLSMVGVGGMVDIYA